MEERRTNDDLILYKLDQMSVKLDNHIVKTEEMHEKTSYLIHGNGSPGLKTAVEILKTRMVIMWGFMTTVLTLVINDYMNRG